MDTTKQFFTDLVSNLNMSQHGIHVGLDFAGTRTINASQGVSKMETKRRIQTMNDPDGVSLVVALGLISEDIEQRETQRKRPTIIFVRDGTFRGSLSSNELYERVKDMRDRFNITLIGIAINSSADFRLGLRPLFQNYEMNFMPLTDFSQLNQQLAASIADNINKCLDYVPGQINPYGKIGNAARITFHYVSLCLGFICLALFI
jgi:hypothetical protein